jgi:endo-1,4-beta-xylanase
LTSDGGAYYIYESERVNGPSIVGTSTFPQYWSVRQSKRISGTVTTGNHFYAWQQLGMETGTFKEQIVAVEAWSGSGEATVTIE